MRGESELESVVSRHAGTQGLRKVSMGQHEAKL
jgi:hypothetical protein